MSLNSANRCEFAPTCIWTFTVPDHERLDAELLALIEEERRISPEGRACAGREMWQSQRQVGEDPPVRELFTSIFRVAEEIAAFLRWDVSGKKPVCKVCWANIHTKGGYHTRHIHPATVQLSGVYYVKAPKGSGDIIFHDLSRFLGLWAAVPNLLESTDYNRSQLAIEPAAGLAVLFPAYVMHEVGANRSDGERVGIAYNINFE
jgi:uncharacterized protein (TIGR02466 family)